MKEGRRRRTPLPLLGLVLLGGCVAPVAEAPPPVQAAPRPVAATGLEVVIGSNAAALIARFGRPAIELREGATRKLQFLGPVCVLDAYLRPPRQGADPVAIHIDARLPDGREMDRASCVAALTAQGASR